MVSGSGYPWRLAELVEASHTVRSTGDHAEGGSRRVRWQPTERLVRYYTTLGLIDGPGELRGRTAFYGLRHLRQLLAIKQLQARGVSLRDVQGQLTGLPDGDLEVIAQLEPGWSSGALSVGALLEEVSVDPEMTPAVAADADSFWERAPQASAPGSAPALPSIGTTWTGVGLSADLMVLVRDIPVENLDRKLLETLARPLIEYLDRHRATAGGRA